MGTRHLIAVHSDGKYPIAQYGQWDGYPNGQGKTVLAFLRDEESVKRLRARLPEISEPTDQEWEDGWRSVGVVEEGWVNQEQSQAFGKLFPFCHRDHGAKILAMVADSIGPAKLQNSLDFAGDSLFCKWAYVVDFDKGAFEVYRGFNKKPVPSGERFADFKGGDGPYAREYFPVRLAKSYRLEELPTEAQFLADFEDDE